jgi:Transport and Golgi organisation 2
VDCVRIPTGHAGRVCTVVVLIRPGHPWPVAMAANRDERLDRAWDPPAAWWPDHPGVIGGRDRSAGGTWMALGPSGVTAAVLNRPGTLGPLAGKRSRGELPLIAAAQPTAEQGAGAIAAMDAGLWRGFNLVLSDALGAFFIRGLGAGRPEIMRLPPGLHMITAHDPNDLESPWRVPGSPVTCRASARRGPPNPGIGATGRRCWATGSGTPNVNSTSIRAEASARSAPPCWHSPGTVRRPGNSPRAGHTQRRSGP